MNLNSNYWKFICGCYKGMSVSFGRVHLLLVFASCVVKAVIFRPAIGILQDKSTLPIDRDMAEYFLSANHINFLRSGGAIVVPIKSYGSDDYYRDMLSKLNGIYFPGGAGGLTRTEYADALATILKLVLQMNDRGTYFPMWTTCLGFQVLVTIIGKKPEWKQAVAVNMEVSLNFTSSAKNSKLFAKASEGFLNMLKTENVVPFNFHRGIKVSHFRQNKLLVSFFKVLSTVTDKRGRDFVATIESRRYPIYGVMWHPEKEPFFWSEQGGLSHTGHAMELSQYVANFLVGEARKNNHSFTSIEEETSLRIENYCPVLHPPPLLRHRFYFNRTSPTRRCDARSVMEGKTIGERAAPSSTSTANQKEDKKSHGKTINGQSTLPLECYCSNLNQDSQQKLDNLSFSFENGILVIRLSETSTIIILFILIILLTVSRCRSRLKFLRCLYH